MIKGGNKIYRPTGASGAKSFWEERNDGANTFSEEMNDREDTYMGKKIMGIGLFLQKNNDGAKTFFGMNSYNSHKIYRKYLCRLTFQDYKMGEGLRLYSEKEMTGHKLFQEMKMTGLPIFSEKKMTGPRLFWGLKFPISPYVGR